MRMFFHIDCHNSPHLSNAVALRMAELGYIGTEGLSNVVEHGYWVERGKREQVKSESIPAKRDSKGNYDPYEQDEQEEDGEESWDFQKWNLDTLFNTSNYEFKKPEVKVKLTKRHTAVVKKDHVLVGCQTIQFDAVEQIYNAIQDIKKEQVQ